MRILFSKKVSLLLVIFGTILLFPSVTRAEATRCRFSCVLRVEYNITCRRPSLAGSGRVTHPNLFLKQPTQTRDYDSAAACTAGCREACNRGCGDIGFLSTTIPGVEETICLDAGAPGSVESNPAVLCPDGELRDQYTDENLVLTDTHVVPPGCVEPPPSPSAACTDPAPPAGARAGQCHFSCITAVDRTNPRGDRPGGGHCDNVTVGPTRNEGSCTIGQNCNCLQTCENICGRSTGGLSKCFIGVNSDTTHFNACDAHGATAPQCGAPAPAAAGTAGSPSTLTNPLGTDDLGVLISRFIRALTGVAGAFALLMFVAGGIIWMTSESSDRAKLAQTIMKNATIGLLMIFFSYAIVNIFLSVLGM